MYIIEAEVSIMYNSKMSRFFFRMMLMLLAVVMLLSSFGVFAFAEPADGADENSASDGVLDDAEGGETSEDESVMPEADENDVIINGDGQVGVEEVSDEELKKLHIEGFERTGMYDDYYQKYAEYDKKLSPIVIDPRNYVSTTASAQKLDSYEGKNGVVKVDKNGEFVYEVQIPETGMYALELTYFPMADKITRDLEFAVYIDGEAPFSSTESLTLKRNWADESDEASYDSVGNELLPAQVLSPKWLTLDFYEPNGNYNEPLKYYLEKGTHTITLKSVSGTFAMSQIRIHNDGSLISYDEYIAQNDAKGAADASTYFELEAEDYVDKTDSIMQNAYDRSDPKVTPYSVSKTTLNTFGGANWNTSLGRVNYTINVEESGYYELSFRYRQSFQRGATIYRRLYIDDVVPFDEAQSLAFDYGSGYQYTVAGRTKEDGTFEPYKVYLEKGTHTFSLEAVIGDMAEASRDVEQAVYQLNYIYRKIIMITGTSPDTNRDYELFESVSDLKAMLLQITDSLKSIKSNVDAVSTNTGGESEILNTLAIQIDSFLEKPYTIPSRLSTFKDNISTLGSWMIEIRDIPLQLDKIIFAGADVKTPGYKSNGFEKAAHEIRAFISSFVDDYTAIGGTSSEEERAITAWVGTGRDQAITLKTLVDNYFTPDTGIKVNVSLVPLGVLSKAIVAGRGPDVALHVSRSEPMNLGFRNALVNLKEYDDYDEVIKRFTDYATVPYNMDTVDADGNEVHKAFALPETQNFTMMFYRKDVFEELKIKVPNTWDEFDAILPIIQENNMSVGIESAISTNLFFTFIMQNGGEVYYEDGSQTRFEEEYAVDAFTKWTNYYTLYDFPLSYSWYTRFRNGEMPLVFESYSNITYLAESAPELKGLWGVAPLPGTVDSTGKINRTESSVGLTAACIVKNNTHSAEIAKRRQDDSWEFLKWWTSAETMAEYGNRIEMAIGPVARYTTANIEAFDLLNWTTEESNAIKEQRKWVKEYPELVGGYYVSRSIVNAFRNVTNNYTNPREMLFYYNDQINDEIWRKRMEYDLYVPEEANK